MVFDSMLGLLDSIVDIGWGPSAIWITEDRLGLVAAPARSPVQVFSVTRFEALECVPAGKVLMRYVLVLMRFSWFLTESCPIRCTCLVFYSLLQAIFC